MFKKIVAISSPLPEEQLNKHYENLRRAYNRLIDDIPYGNMKPSKYGPSSDNTPSFHHEPRSHILDLLLLPDVFSGVNESDTRIQNIQCYIRKVCNAYISVDKDSFKSSVAVCLANILLFLKSFENSICNYNDLVQNFNGVKLVFKSKFEQLSVSKADMKDVLLIFFRYTTVIPGQFRIFLEFETVLADLNSHSRLGDFELGLIDGLMYCKREDINSFSAEQRKNFSRNLVLYILKANKKGGVSHLCLRSLIWTCCKLSSPDQLINTIHSFFDPLISDSLDKNWQIPYALLCVADVFGMHLKQDYVQAICTQVTPLVRSEKTPASICYFHEIVMLNLVEKSYKPELYSRISNHLFQPSDFVSVEMNIFYMIFLRNAVKTFSVRDSNVITNRLNLDGRLINFDNFHKSFRGQDGFYQERIYESAMALAFLIKLADFSTRVQKDEIYNAIVKYLHNPKRNQHKPQFVKAVQLHSDYLIDMLEKPFSEVFERITNSIDDRLDTCLANFSIEIIPCHELETIIDADFVIESVKNPLAVLKVNANEEASHQNLDSNFELNICCLADLNKFSEWLDKFNLPVRSFDIPQQRPAEQKSPTPKDGGGVDSEQAGVKKQKVKTRKPEAKSVLDSSNEVSHPEENQEEHPVVGIIRAAMTECVRKNVKVNALKKELNDYFRKHARSKYNLRIGDAEGGTHRHLKISWVENYETYSIEIAAGHIKHSEYSNQFVLGMCDEFVSAAQRLLQGK